MTSYAAGDAKMYFPHVLRTISKVVLICFVLLQLYVTIMLIQCYE